VTSHRRAALLLLAGLALVHVAWVLAVPPFRGIDEFDHVYRAASVSQGQVRPYSEPVADGRGDYVRVPQEIVADAGPVCGSYAYVGSDNCYSAEQLEGGAAKVASAAARYHPAYYGLVGTVAAAWSGADFVYAARLATVSLCLGLWGIACYAAARSRSPQRMMFALGVSSTPVLIYSGSMVAPNGLEIAAAVACWTGFLAMENRLPQRTERTLVTLTALAAVVLTTVRTLGPLWLLLLVLTVALLPGRHKRLKMLQRNRTVSALCVVAVGFATALSVWWVYSARTNSLAQESGHNFPDPWLNTLVNLPLWILQSIAAFPTRNEPAPTAVYALVLAALAVAILTSAGVRDRSWRWAFLAMVLVWLVPPFVFTGLTYEGSGAIWQGRYSLPFSIGILLVLLTWRRHQEVPLPRPVLFVVGGAYAAAHALSIAVVRRTELESSPLSGDPRWITTSEPVIVGLAVIGTALMFAAAPMVSKTRLPLVPPRPIPREGVLTK
jgi:hypothetical protein